MITTGETIADAPRPFFGTDENATPSAVELAVPSISNQVKVTHLLGSVGKFKPKKAIPMASKIRTCTTMLAKTEIALPMK